MTLINILLSAYLLCIIADDFAIWAFNKRIQKVIGNREVDDLPKHIHGKVTKLYTVKKVTRQVIRTLQVVLVIPIASTVIVAIGSAILYF